MECEFSKNQWLPIVWDCIHNTQTSEVELSLLLKIVDVQPGLDIMKKVRRSLTKIY